MKQRGTKLPRPSHQRLLDVLRRSARAISPLLPSTPAFNYAVAAPLYFASFLRLPRRPSHPRATINDFWFYRKIGRWSAFERRCCDKVDAKVIARELAPDVKTIGTLAVLDITPSTTVEEVAAFLAPHRGLARVAKPAHSSGGILFLNAYAPADVANLLSVSRRDYVWWSREAQYAELPKRILIEPSLSDDQATAPSDYKFFCSRGQVFFCQVDVDRFTGHKRALVSPDFEWLNVEFRYSPPDEVQRPVFWSDMLAIAKDLSKPFDFVRVDLYECPDGVYFGEFTFTPEAGHAAFSEPGFGAQLLALVLPS